MAVGFSAKKGPDWLRFLFHNGKDNRDESIRNVIIKKDNNSKDLKASTKDPEIPVSTVLFMKIHT